MRVGNNPLRKTTLPAYRRHRVIMPVYIPNEEGYFQEAMAIFRLSLDTLLATVDPENTSITVLDNASIDAVRQLLAPHLQAGRIDRYVRHETNRGKADPVAGELKACYEDFLTITDNDVLFESGWQERVEAAFRAFPAAGAVSPSPAPWLTGHAAATTWIHGLLTGGIRRRPLANLADLDEFEKSVGKTLVDPPTRRSQFLLSAPGGDYLLGAGHFVVTVRRECYVDFGYRPGLGGTGVGEREIDRQVDRAGFLRLSTPDAHVRHMGNVLEPWMQERAARILATQAKPLSQVPPRKPGVLARLLAALPFAVRELVGKSIGFVASRLFPVRG